MFPIYRSDFVAKINLKACEYIRPVRDFTRVIRDRQKETAGSDRHLGMQRCSRAGKEDKIRDIWCGTGS